ncbi:hypothetical protein B6N60_00474 [Richelia sinica FACHB-800]|uniref:Uncharacterized protein n=1 Tax=Richelia sinica FACHB-800 TaxID=1357546 RepID=A0A975Y357_9NOST|nr:hypothetical protein [Richelia sinica]MBD2662955.1 hypothetical protein [Richelia sinica FACHB-800]QXE21796.1 hypothetical protein B6N60_00474 [Richelia sinica FACHB-800]
MIHHISIAAGNPEHVSQVLAEVMDGKAFPFFPHPGSYIVLPLDQYGTGIEIYPLNTELVPGEGEEQCNFVDSIKSSPFVATHAAVSVPTSREKIEEIGQREGWKVLYCNRDSVFDVIEFWIENRIMIEFLTPEMASKYLEATHPENLQKIFADFMK